MYRRSLVVLDIVENVLERFLFIFGNSGTGM